MAIYSLSDILFTFKELISFTERNSKSKERQVEMLVSIRIAIVETREYISDHGYENNVELSKYWLDAFDKAKKTNIYSGESFPEFIYNKARFWGDPQTWLREPSALESVPELNFLEKECNSVLVRVK